MHIIVTVTRCCASCLLPAFFDGVPAFQAPRGFGGSLCMHIREAYHHVKIASREGQTRYKGPEGLDLNSKVSEVEGNKIGCNSQ